MAISTRSVEIAHGAGSIVDFGARDPLGLVSERIFMSHATGSSTSGVTQGRVGELRTSVSKILTVCGGLPIALAVTGCAVALLARTRGNFEAACDTYATALEEKSADPGDEEARRCKVECKYHAQPGVPSSRVHEVEGGKKRPGCCPYYP